LFLWYRGRCSCILLKLPSGLMYIRPKGWPEPQIDSVYIGLARTVYIRIYTPYIW